MKDYMFNVMNTYVVEAESETEARELLDSEDPSVRFVDGDIMLVSVD